jgi:hypothetical protein
MANHRLLRTIWSYSSGRNESLAKAELGDNTARPRVRSIAGERTWPELGFWPMREIRERKEDAMDLRFSQRRGRHLIGIKEQIERWKTTISPDGSHLLVNTDSVSGLGPCWTG